MSMGMRYQPQGRVRLAPQWADRIKFIATSGGLVVTGVNPACTKVVAKTGIALQTAVGQYLAHFPNVFSSDVDITRASVSVLTHVRDLSDGGFGRTVIAFAAANTDAGILKSSSGNSRFYCDLASTGASFVTYNLDKSRPRLHTITGTGLTSPKTVAYVGDFQIGSAPNIPVGNGISIGCHGLTTQNVQSISEFYFVIGCSPALTREEHNSLDRNPWQLFAAPNRVREATTVGGVNTFSYTGTTGLALTPTADWAVGMVRIVMPSGGGVFTPTSSVSVGNGIQSQTVTATTGFALSGTVPVTRSNQYTLLGGLTFTGQGSIALFPDPTPRPARAYKRGRRPRFRIL